MSEMEIDKSTLVHVNVEAIGPQINPKEPSNSNHNIPPKEHPLNNVLVLDAIFDYLSKKDWKLARLVNKTWHSTLQARWRDQVDYKVGVVKTHNEDNRNISEAALFSPEFLEQQHPTNNPNDPMELGRHPIRNILSKYTTSPRSLGYVNTIIDSPHLAPDQTGFWELFGHGLKRINLDGVRIAQGALFKTILFELTPNLEEFRYCRCKCEDWDKVEVNNTVTSYTPPATLQNNLRSLELDISNYEVFNPDNYNNMRFPISWLEFFSVFPKIQKVKLQIESPVGVVEGERDLLKLFDAIDIIRKANNNEVLNFPELHLGEMNCTDADLIKNRSLLATLPISNLILDVTFMNNDQIPYFVKNFGSTLRHLTIMKVNEQYWEDDFLPYDILPQELTKLELMGNFFSSFGFLSYTPNLEELKMVDISDMLQTEFCVDLAAISPLVNLTKLEYILRDLVPLENMQIFAKLMPNVKTCVCTVDTDGFQALCHGWTNLEHLDVMFDFDSEDFFVENLIQLKRLRSLKIYSNNVTNHSVFEGFLKLPLLTRIQLPQLPERISEEGFQALKRNNRVISVFQNFRFR